MKEKTLIISNNKRIVKKIKILLIIFTLLFIASLISFCIANQYQKKASGTFESCWYTEQGLKKALSNYHSDKDCMEVAKEEYPLWSFSETPRTIGLVGLCIFTPITILFFILFLISNKMELTITDKRVYGKSVFKKRVDLPNDSISAISTNLFGGITVSTSSGKIKWYMIDNKEKVYNILSELIVRRQN